MAVEVPNPFEWNSAWDKEDEETNKNNKEAFELVKKVDENREDADAKKVQYHFLKNSVKNFKMGNNRVHESDFDWSFWI